MASLQQQKVQKTSQMATLGDASASAGVLTPMEAEQAPGEVTPKPKRKRSTQNSMLNINQSNSERSRDGRSSVSPAPESSPELLEPRTRPLAGAMADEGIYIHHARLSARGIYNWRNYGKIPTPKVVVKGGLSTKIFEWTGLFKNVKGRKVFVESGAGKDVLRISEAEIDFWDRVRMRWLAKKYGRHYLLDWVPPENFMRTWGHRKCF